MQDIDLEDGTLSLVGTRLMLKTADGAHFAVKDIALRVFDPTTRHLSREIKLIPDPATKHDGVHIETGPAEGGLVPDGKTIRLADDMEIHLQFRLHFESGTCMPNCPPPPPIQGDAYRILFEEAKRP